jgi:hypothetical protein
MDDSLVTMFAYNALENAARKTRTLPPETLVRGLSGNGVTFWARWRADELRGPKGLMGHRGLRRGL